MYLSIFNDLLGGYHSGAIHYTERAKRIASSDQNTATLRALRLTHHALSSTL